MSFIFLMLVFSFIAYVPQFFFGDKKDYRMALRHGMAGGFTFTAIDHFLSAETRYVPILPGFLASYALELVYFSGVAELLGALGLVLPLALYKRLGLLNLRKWAGIGLAVMLVFLVIANINVAMKGSSVAGLEFGAWYYWLRPLLQPVIILWALYVSGVIWKPGKKETNLVVRQPNACVLFESDSSPIVRPRHGAGIITKGDEPCRSTFTHPSKEKSRDPL